MSENRSFRNYSFTPFTSFVGQPTFLLYPVNSNSKDSLVGNARKFSIYIFITFNVMSMSCFVVIVSLLKKWCWIFVKIVAESGVVILICEWQKEREKSTIKNFKIKNCKHYIEWRRCTTTVKFIKSNLCSLKLNIRLRWIKMCIVQFSKRSKEK